MTAEALQTTLAAEHAAVWVYGVLGGQTSRSDAPGLYDDVSAAYRVHRGRRDLLTQLIADGGAEPAAAEVGYALGPVDSPARVTAAAPGLGHQGPDRRSGPPAAIPGESRDLPRCRRAGEPLTGPLTPGPVVTCPSSA